MDKMYQIAQQTKYKFLGKGEGCKFVEGTYSGTLIVSWLRSLNMNTAEFVLSRLQELKLCVNSETHNDVVALVVRIVFVCLVVWYV